MKYVFVKRVSGGTTKKPEQIVRVFFIDYFLFALDSAKA